jgi:KUP system potassium uptake protein
VITPAVSVLSAIEGLEVATVALKPAVVPLTIAVLLGIFAVQKHGTSGIGRVFGPLTLLWFAILAALGLAQLVRRPDVLLAIDPRHAFAFFVQNQGQGFLVLGSVFLVVTGGEALYADMGHFGRSPIRRAWFAVVFPALLLNYFGQGAMLLEQPGAASNPFYSIVPTWALYPVVIVATMATVVASQALISGAFSLTQQAVQLGFFPRVTIVQTSREWAGQIYVPEINSLLRVGCIGCVLLFQTSTALAAAYGIAVTGTMGITTLIYFVVTTKAWGWSWYRAVPLLVLFLAFDLGFFIANAAKFAHGGWFPVALAIGLFTLMTTWHRGRQLLAEAIAPTLLPLDIFLTDVAATMPHRVKGTSIFMASSQHGTPPALLHNFKHNQVLHEQVVLLSVQSAPVPEVSPDESLTVDKLGHGFFRVNVKYGFSQQPDVLDAVARCAEHGLVVEPERASYYLGRETLVPIGASKLSRWRKQLFVYISRNSRSATAYFGLPPNRVVELGTQIQF